MFGRFGTENSDQSTVNSFVQIYFLDFLLFQKVLPWYKERIRGPNLEFEHLERELSNSSVWPPLGKNNEVKVGEEKYEIIFNVNLNFLSVFSIRYKSS